jgi:hypothetical protein
LLINKSNLRKSAVNWKIQVFGMILIKLRHWGNVELS